MSSPVVPWRAEILLEGGELILEDELGIVEQPADQGRLAVIDGAAGQKAQQPLVTGLEHVGERWMDGHEPVSSIARRDWGRTALVQAARDVAKDGFQGKGPRRSMVSQGAARLSRSVARRTPGLPAPSS